MRIVYLSWPTTEVTGGIKSGIRHVESLCEAGHDAVLAAPGGQRPGWFQTIAPIIDTSALAPGDDILVFPENHFELFRSFANWPNRKLVFCRNHFYAWRGLGDCNHYADFGVTGALCTGRYVAAYFRVRFPSLPIAIMPSCVDLNVFRLQGQKKLQIAFAPHKRPMEAAFIRDLFRAEAPENRRIPWIEIAKMNESQVAAVLGESAIYLSLCRLEAFAQSLLEAMACGCVVAGFTGIGAREYTTSRNGFWAAEDDCLDCAEQLRRAVRLVAEGGPAYADTLEAAALTARQHGRDVLGKRVVAFWKAYIETGRFPTWT
jgi:Glycosyl transferases group 1